MPAKNDPRFDWCREQLSKPTPVAPVSEDGSRYRVDCPDSTRSVWFDTLNEAIDYSEQEWKRLDESRRRWRERLAGNSGEIEELRRRLEEIRQIAESHMDIDDNGNPDEWMKIATICCGEDKP